ncbi:glyoxalase family protein [Luminiphilus syltensis NOR5-1B]|uniref:Glyoxalase family protein n=1 Tax=Luminiphilus syltensis NOR5-1B TaxID=565045 RepID=B8KT59_9GAMM|nr:VOC family protein [Luminiphilus syltensis]EED34589.1 glyoxalase family protein [Luminiphilus syltensis NOR5-1B]
MALFSGVVSLAGTAVANEANLTRFGPETYELVRGEPQTRVAHFKAIDGPAKLILQDNGIDYAKISVNGIEVAGPESFTGEGERVVPLTLAKDNSIEIKVPGKPEGSLGVRITQHTVADDIGIVQQGYFGLNTTDIERQRELYKTLGFIGEIYPAGPETSTTFARSLGFLDDYLIHVSLHSLKNPPEVPFVDTVQFRGDSFREEPPYEKLNHLGMAYATYSTTDLDGDYEYLKSQGLDFLSAPTEAPNGERFVFFRDEDGIFIKFIHTDEGPEPTPGPNLVELVNTNMNVSDLERSVAFYKLLGFTESAPASQAGGGEFAAAHGFDEPIAFEGVDLSLPGDTNRATLQLRQWTTPYDGSPPYPAPVNHLGIDRINFYVEDLTRAIKIMQDLGFEQLGPIGGMPEIAIVFFYDPDGIKVQIAGPQKGLLKDEEE